jgi:hypothetical protein
MRQITRRSFVVTLAVTSVLVTGTHLAAQGPPIQGTIALEGTMTKFYRAANVVVVATIDGVEHTYHFARDLVVHGGKKPGVDALEGLREGTTVVVHYTSADADEAAREVDIVGGEGLQVTEGLATHLDRRRHEITIRHADGKVETFRLTDRALAEAPGDVDAATAATTVIIYYTDEHGQRVAHFFRAVH